LAQTPADPGVVVGVGGFSHIVANVEKSVEFYRDVLGLEMPNPPRAFDSTQWIIDMGNTPGAQFRRSSALIPGTSVMMAFMEFKDIDRKPVHTRVQDPGTAILQVGVRDVDATVKALKAAGVTVISKNGEPVVNGASKFCLVRDPNNLFLELFQRAAKSQ
jgi:catechol 2,3-dioxygenase-like lactoylglutathione lyase family enzyme